MLCVRSGWLYQLTPKLILDPNKSYQRITLFPYGSDPVWFRLDQRNDLSQNWIPGPDSGHSDELTKKIIDYFISLLNFEASLHHQSRISPVSFDISRLLSSLSTENNLLTLTLVTGYDLGPFFRTLIQGRETKLTAAADNKDPHRANFYKLTMMNYNLQGLQCNWWKDFPHDEI